MATTTVYFATNRVLNGPAEDWKSYGTSIVSPSDPAAITYAVAFVDNTELTADKTGLITDIRDVEHGRFSENVISDLREPGRNLLVFIHGFDNDFEASITRAAFNREWFAQSGVPAADTTVVAFSWPSLGRLLDLPLPWGDYRRDQTLAGQSGFHMMSFLAGLQPILDHARATGRRVSLLAHSMGNLALQAAVESWFSHGNGDALLFEEVILAAADERYDSFEFPEPGRLSDLYRLGHRISIYFSRADSVLVLAAAINLGAKRLGQDGPHNRFDTTRFPPAQYRMIDCTGFRDYAFNFASSHQYYRRSPSVRADIAQVMTGFSQAVSSRASRRRRAPSLARGRGP
jgi:esterase/lipase superfamily enzyme